MEHKIIDDLKEGYLLMEEIKKKIGKDKSVKDYLNNKTYPGVVKNEEEAQQIGKEWKLRDLLNERILVEEKIKPKMNYEERQFYKGFKEVEESKEEHSEKSKLIWDKDLKNYAEEEKEWIINKLIPAKSIIILSGKRGTMKTFISLNIGYSIASGTNFLKNFPTRKGGVIYLDKENGIAIMKRRTEMIKKGMELEDNDLKIGFICFSQIKVDKTKGIGEIEEFIKEHKPLLLIIDTYRRSISFDENDAGAVSELFVDTLRPLAEKYDLSILLIHHNRKGGSGESTDEMDEIRGSSDLANYADIIFKTERRGNTLVLKQLKNRNAPEEKPIQINLDSDEENFIKFNYGGEYEKQSKADKCVEIISIWLAEKQITQFKTGDAKEIAFKNGIKESSFKNALQIMCDIGEIENVGFGMYKTRKND